tara:strand:- start:1654 stop:1836 length:183 start_codon:yes stop_codon:yes gene_type:complete
MKFIVTVGAMFIAGQKYKRGDVVEVRNAAQYGTQLDQYVEEKPKAVRKSRAKKEIFDEDK